MIEIKRWQALAVAIAHILFILERPSGDCEIALALLLIRPHPNSPLHTYIKRHKTATLPRKISEKTLRSLKVQNPGIYGSSNRGNQVSALKVRGWCSAIPATVAPTPRNATKPYQLRKAGDVFARLEKAISSWYINWDS
jgi:hypothetical protein